MSAPEGILCTKTHEYLIEDSKNVYKLGITEHAVEQLGDIVFVELPEIGAEFAKGDVFGTIESVKAASELYMPVGGKILELNEALEEQPELVNADTYEKGWFVKVEVSEPEDLKGLMDNKAYQAQLEE